MKLNILPIIFTGSAVMLMINACTTTSKLTGSSTDDVYNTTAQAKEVRQPRASTSSQTYSEDGQQDYAYVPDSSAEYSGIANNTNNAQGTVYDDEAAYNNQYYDDNLYYSSRINRFYNNRNFAWRGYFDPFYSSFYDPFWGGGFNSAFNWGRPAGFGFGIGWGNVWGLGNNWAFDPFFNGYYGFNSFYSPFNAFGYGGWGLGYGGWGLGFGGFNSGFGNFPVAIINNPNYRPRPSRAEGNIGRPGNPNFPRQGVVQRDAAGNILNTASRSQRWAETDRVSRSSDNGDINSGRTSSTNGSSMGRPRPSRVSDGGGTIDRTSSAPRQSAPSRSSSPERASRPERSSSQPQRSPERTYSPPPSSSRSGSSYPSSGGGSSRSSGGGGSSRPSRAGGGR